jgi:hypothetical protein
MMITRSHLRIFGGVGLVVSLLTFGRPVSAVQFGNCQDVSGSYDWASLTYCGEYQSENGVPEDLDATGQSFVESYNFGSNFELYWWGRVTPFDEPGYYSGGGTVW